MPPRGVSAYPQRPCLDVACSGMPAQHYTNHSHYHPRRIQLLSLKEMETAYEAVHCTISRLAVFISARAP